MNILTELTEALKTNTQLPIETGVFCGKAPSTYLVLTPLFDTYPLSADDYPQADLQEVRISLFTQDNYIQTKNRIVALLLKNDFTITERRYNGYDNQTKYHNYSIDVQKIYLTEETI